MPKKKSAPRAPRDVVHLVWLTGPSCDGCTIGVLGDTTHGGLETLLQGKVPGVPLVRVVHSALSLESGDEFMALMHRAWRGELDPFALIVEASIPDEQLAGSGFFSGLGDEEGRPVPIATWVDRLAPRAGVVVGYGDCGVWGGPHALEPNPVNSTGAGMYLGVDYRSVWQLPVINLPGCCAPTVLLETLVRLLRHVYNGGPALELDDTNRPVFGYPPTWKGALPVWSS